ncbi:MAG: hypothetical protein M1391_10605 [Bacteroidetes bacterium]|nr:hypothetical protein [Bacteroidota bacterium]
MFNNVVLNVVIGLVFIFLLYSLLATTLCELIATFLGLRAKSLASAIRRMLDDEPEKSNIYGDLFSLLKAAFNRTVYLLLYIFPFGKNGKQRYKGDKLSDKFYDDSKVKYLSSNYFFSKPSYISPKNFADILINILLDGKSFSAAAETIRTNLENNSLQIDTETHKQILGYFQQAQGDLEKFKASLMNWFDETMERLTGWYKRKTQVITLIVGLVLAMSFNVNTIEIVNNLSKDSKAREELAAMAEEFIKNPQAKTNLEIADSIKVSKDSLLWATYKNLDSLANKSNNVMGLGWNFTKVDSISLSKSADAKMFASVLGILKNKENVNKQGRILNSDSTLCALFEDQFIAPFKLDKKTLGVIGDASIDSLNNVKIYAAINYSVFEKIWIVIDETFSSWRRILGFLLTALAISLGAPFWFDLLGKFVQLRSTGPRIGTKSTESATPDDKGEGVFALFKSTKKK